MRALARKVTTARRLQRPRAYRQVFGFCRSISVLFSHPEFEQFPQHPRQTGVVFSGPNQRQIRRLIAQAHIDVSHFTHN